MDDDSMSSTTNYTTQSLSSRTENSAEESGWTLYFEDFLANNNNNNNNISENNNVDEEEVDTYSFSCSRHQNSSLLVSDADFRKVATTRKMVSINRKGTAKKFVDEELEDTASSPSNSPKVDDDLKELYMKSKELDTQDISQVNYSYSILKEHTKDKYMDFSQEKVQNLQHAEEGNNNMGYLLESQLRRKGLCLVPISMLY